MRHITIGIATAMLVAGSAFAQSRPNATAASGNDNQAIGEIGITGTGAAVANAVFNATGKRVRDVPITQDKLM